MLPYLCRPIPSCEWPQTFFSTQVPGKFDTALCFIDHEPSHFINQAIVVIHVLIRYILPGFDNWYRRQNDQEPLTTLTRPFTQ